MKIKEPENLITCNAYGGFEFKDIIHETAVNEHALGKVKNGTYKWQRSSV